MNTFVTTHCLSTFPTRVSQRFVCVSQYNKLRVVISRHDEERVWVLRDI